MMRHAIRQAILNAHEKVTNIISGERLFKGEMDRELGEGVDSYEMLYGFDLSQYTALEEDIIGELRAHSLSTIEQPSAALISMCYHRPHFTEIESLCVMLHALREAILSAREQATDLIIGKGLFKGEREPNEGVNFYGMLYGLDLSHYTALEEDIIGKLRALSPALQKPS